MLKVHSTEWKEFI